MKNLFLDAALDYARRDLAVIALHSPNGKGGCTCGKADCGTPGKHPRWNEMDLPHGANSATTDEKIIRIWWKRWPQANVGIATGKKSGMIVVDIDPRNGGDKSLKRLPGNLPFTVTTRTGGKGEHYYTKYPDNGLKIPNDQNFAGYPGIDLKSDGGFVVAPPSRHISGEDYYWKIGLDHPIAPTPNWLIELVKKEDTPERKSAPVGEVIPQGRRVKTLVSLAGTMRRRGMNEPALLAALEAVNLTQCESPLPDSKIQDIARSCGRYEPGTISGTPGTPQWTPAEEEAYDKAEQEAKQGEPLELPPDRRGPAPEPKKPTLKPFTARELGAKEFPAPRWAIPDLIPEGLTILGGRPKIGKSWFALNLAVAAATGGMALGKIQVEKGECLYLALEDAPRRLKERLEKIIPFGDLPETLHFITANDFPLLFKGGLDALSAWLTDHPQARLLVIDTLARVKPPRGKNADPYEHDSQVMAALQGLAALHQLALIVVAHTKKGKEDDFLSNILGSSGQTGVADCVAELTRKARGQMDGILKLTGRDIEEKELAMRFSPDLGLWELLGEAREHDMSKERQDILLILKETGPKKPAQLAKLLDKKSGAVRIALMRMKDKKEVILKEDGSYEYSV